MADDKKPFGETFGGQLLTQGFELGGDLLQGSQQLKLSTSEERAAQANARAAYAQSQAAAALASAEKAETRKLMMYGGGLLGLLGLVALARR